MARTPSDEPHVIKQGDTGPPIYVLCEDENGPVSLLGAAIRFIMVQRDGTKTVIGTAQAVNDAADEDDPDRGWVFYELASDGSDTDTPGVYRAEVEVTYAPGTSEERVETFPAGTEERDAYLSVIVRPQLA